MLYHYIDRQMTNGKSLFTRATEENKVYLINIYIPI